MRAIVIKQNQRLGGGHSAQSTVAGAAMEQKRKATSTMPPPLHKFLQSTIGAEHLRSACIVEDNARPKRRQRLLTISPKESYTEHTRSTVSLHSLPSLTSDSSVSRWDSVVKPTSDCLSPPLRRPRRANRSDQAPTPPISRQQYRRPSMPRPSNEVSVRDAASASFKSFQSTAKSYQSPTFPIRQTSLNRQGGLHALPKPPCWSDGEESSSSSSHSDSPSPTSVRAGLDEILGKALDECLDLGAEDCDFEHDFAEDEDDEDDDGLSVVPFECT